jgi:hypothetical protein
MPPSAQQKIRRYSARDWVPTSPEAHRQAVVAASGLKNVSSSGNLGDD